MNWFKQKKEKDFKVHYLIALDMARELASKAGKDTDFLMVNRVGEISSFIDNALIDFKGDVVYKDGYRHGHLTSDFLVFYYKRIENLGQHKGVRNFFNLTSHHE